MEEELIETKKELRSLQRRFNELYKSNDQKKQDNYKLREENKFLKNKNYELTILIDTFLKNRRKNMKQITEKEREILYSIEEYIRENKISPTVRELCDINNLSSPATIHFHLKKLREKGYIEYRQNLARSIVILKKA